MPTSGFLALSDLFGPMNLKKTREVRMSFTKKLEATNTYSKPI
jgi:hypothetical protein